MYTEVIEQFLSFWQTYEPPTEDTYQSARPRSIVGVFAKRFADSRISYYSPKSFWTKLLANMM